MTFIGAQHLGQGYRGRESAEEEVVGLGAAPSN